MFVGICSLVNHLFISFAHFQYWLPFLLIYDSCLYIMDTVEVAFDFKF